MNTERLSHGADKARRIIDYTKGQMGVVHPGEAIARAGMAVFPDHAFSRFRAPMLRAAGFKNVDPSVAFASSIKTNVCAHTFTKTCHPIL